MWVGRHRPSRVVLAGALLLCSAGCASGGSSGSGGSSHPTRTVRVLERDFKISAPNRLRPGAVDFSIHNRGPDDHEFIVVRIGHRPLPLRKDGLTVDEDAVEKETVGALEPAAPGVERLRVHLKPGSYELICNMSGHYMGGMHARLDVS
jgi:uncharacterized cupredoxin-like copper-binding protein